MKERRNKLIKNIKIGYIPPWWKEGGESKYRSLLQYYFLMKMFYLYFNNLIQAVKWLS